MGNEQVANTEIPRGPKRPASVTKRKIKDGLVTIAYLGARTMPMKYEIYVDGAMTKLTFGNNDRDRTAKVAPVVADVLTGKTPSKFEGDRPVDAVVVIGKVTDSGGERWAEV